MYGTTAYRFGIAAYSYKAHRRGLHAPCDDSTAPGRRMRTVFLRNRRVNSHSHINSGMYSHRIHNKPMDASATVDTR